MKNAAVRFIRRILPSGAVHGVEEIYRIARVKVISAWFLNPAKRLKVIAVTGTNGKTTTVNYINEILKQAGKTTAMFSTAQIEVAGAKTVNDLNATVGTVSRMQRFFRQAKNANVDFVVMEFPSHALVQHKLDGIPIEVAVMTNLTQDHLDYHKTMQKYAEAKALLFRRQPNFTVLNQDDEWFEYFAQFPARKSRAGYGESLQADVRISEYASSLHESSANITYGDKSTQITTSLPGKFNMYNAAAAASAARLLGIDARSVVAGIKRLKAIPGRFEFVDSKAPFSVIVDYAHTPDGLEKILDTVRDITKGEVILVFGSCGDRDKGKRPIMGEIAAARAGKIVLTDEESYSENADTIRRNIYDGICRVPVGKAKTTEIADRKAAIQLALEQAKPNDTVLITGLGHEVFRIMGGKKIPWNDTEVVKKLLETI